MAKLNDSAPRPPGAPATPAEAKFRRLQIIFKYGRFRSAEEVMARSPPRARVHPERDNTVQTTKKAAPVAATKPVFDWKNFSPYPWLWSSLKRESTSAINLAGSPVETEAVGNKGQPMGCKPTTVSSRVAVQVKTGVPAKRGAVGLKNERPVRQGLSRSLPLLIRERGSKRR